MKLLGKRNLEIIKLASNDETRQALNGLYVDGDTTVVTDGHKLIRVKSQSPPVCDWPVNGIKWTVEEPFIIDKKTVEKALKNIPKKQAMPILHNVAVGLIKVDEGEVKKAVCQTTDLERTENIEARTVEGKFPDYKRVIPDYENESEYSRIGISAKYLMEVCSVLKNYDEKMGFVTLYFKKEGTENHSIVLTAEDGEGNEATAVIMPVRL